MRRFEYIRPGSVEETVRFLQDNGDASLVIGGGTAAVVLMSMGVLRPHYVVDLGGIAALQGAQAADGGGMHLGALTTIRALERDPEIQRDYGLLAEAAGQVANVRVRNMATVGGSICYGEPQTDTPPALIALGATVAIAGPAGSRTTQLATFFKGPYETVLEPGELLTGVSIPPSVPGTGGCHLKFTIGSSESKPVVNVSALVRVEPASQRCVDARIVVGAVGPVPLVADEAAARLSGIAPDEKLITEVARAAAEQTEPQDDLRGPVWYKRRITQVLVERALRCALQKAKDNRGPA